MKPVIIEMNCFNVVSAQQIFTQGILSQPQLQHKKTPYLLKHRLASYCPETMVKLRQTILQLLANAWLFLNERVEQQNNSPSIALRLQLKGKRNRERR